MLLTVLVSDWELEESGRILSVGDRDRFWLTFAEVGRGARAPEPVSAIRGVAVPLPDRPGAELGRHPVRIDLDAGALYWDAPEPVTGAIDVVGTISTNDVDVPEGFPETSGVVRRLRMVWQDFVFSPGGVWRSTGDGSRYDEVTSTYFPASDRTALAPGVEAELRRRARQAYDREVAAGRPSPGAPFQVGLKVPSSTSETPAGTTETRWTGVLIGLETADAGPE